MLQRMLYENETAYVDALERTWTSSVALRIFVGGIASDFTFNGHAVAGEPSYTTLNNFTEFGDQLGIDPDGTTPSTTAEQACVAWRNVAAQLSEPGMGFDNLVKVTTIIPDADKIPASRPASTFIVAGLANPGHRMRLISSPLLLWFDQLI